MVASELGCDAPLTVALVPSVSGGLGHVARTAALARALVRAAPATRICYVLDELNLRPFNVTAVERIGFPVRILPNPVHHERNARIAAVLGDVDVVVEDTNRRLIPYRRVLPRLRAWVSIPMHPIWDELFMDWPLLEHVDRILYAYPSVMPLPEELEPFCDNLIATGPILDLEGTPSRTEARARLGLALDRRYVLYAPRGFPFGEWFGRRILRAVVGGVLRLRRALPELELVLIAVPDPAAVQPRGLPPLAEIPGVTVVGTVDPEQARDYLAGADVAVVEGTSTLFEAACLGTRVVMIPGPIHETALIGTWVNELGAGIVLRPEHATPATLEKALAAALSPAGRERADRLAELVGADGAERAAAAVLAVTAKRGA